MEKEIVQGLLIDVYKRQVIVPMKICIKEHR